MQADYVLELPNDLRAIDNAVAYLVDRCRDLGCECERLGFRFRVGVTEALSNAMLYGNGRDPRKRVRIEASITAASIVIRVTDEGVGFDPASLPDPRLPANRSRPAGRGLFLIRELMDRVEFNERGNSITMILLRHPANGGREQSV